MGGRLRGVFVGGRVVTLDCVRCFFSFDVVLVGFSLEDEG